MTKYIRNEFGGIHSVDDETPGGEGKTPFEALHIGTTSGNRFLPPGWSEISEAEAKKAAPQLFGKADPTVNLNARERADAAALSAYKE